MKILLIDADSTIPNLALMRLSGYYKAQGAEVDLLRLGLPYYPRRKKQRCPINTSGYDKAFASIIFDVNKDYVKGEGIVFGGTGYDLKTKLPADVEATPPDYSLYPENRVSYGFITRGCARKCSFCKVPEKEGYIHQVATIPEIVRHKTVRFLDNNILALATHKEILAELVKLQLRCQFNQGLDIRLIDAENSELLRRLNYDGEYTFAFDNIALQSLIIEKLQLLNWRKPWQLRFFVYIHPTMPLRDTVQRIISLRKVLCLPYIMRDISCWGSEYQDFYTDLAAWCNQVWAFKKYDFAEFLQKRHKNKGRIEASLNCYYNVL